MSTVCDNPTFTLDQLINELYSLNSQQTDNATTTRLVPTVCVQQVQPEQVQQVQPEQVQHVQQVSPEQVQPSSEQPSSVPNNRRSRRRRSSSSKRMTVCSAKRKRAIKKEEKDTVVVPQECVNTVDTVGWVQEAVRDAPSVTWFNTDAGLQYTVRNTNNHGPALIKLQLFEDNMLKHSSSVYTEFKTVTYNRAKQLSANLNNLWVDQQTGNPKVNDLERSVMTIPAWRYATSTCTNKRKRV